jgi:hypothetical protein
MALEAATFCRFFLGSFRTMALLARLNSGEQHIALFPGCQVCVRGTLCGTSCDVRDGPNSACDSQRTVRFDLTTSGRAPPVGLSVWHCLQVFT